MGGLQFCRFFLSTEKKRPASARPTLSEEQQEDGWRFIQKEGELDKSELKQLRCIHRHISRDISREGSPIHGWSEKLVQRALDSLQNDGCLSAKITRWDLTIQDFEVEVVRMLESVLPHLCDQSLWLLGEPGVGKTPLGRTIAMAFSRYNEGTGAFRSASDFDFFRGVPFSKATPALYDDGDIFAEPIKKIKAFCDVEDYETILKEGWFMVNFSRYLFALYKRSHNLCSNYERKPKLRAVLDNSYDLNAATTAATPDVETGYEKILTRTS